MVVVCSGLALFLLMSIAIHFCLRVAVLAIFFFSVGVFGIFPDLGHRDRRKWLILKVSYNLRSSCLSLSRVFSYDLFLFRQLVYFGILIKCSLSWPSS